MPKPSLESSSFTVRRPIKNPLTKNIATPVPPAREVASHPTVLSSLWSTSLSVALWALIVGIIVIPLTYVPRLAAIGEWARQSVLLLVVGVGLVAVLVHMIRRKAIALPKAWWLFAIMAGASLVWLLSALLSSTRYMALYGYDGAEGQSALTFVALALTTVLVSLLGTHRRKLYYAWIIGSALALVLSLLSLYKISVFPGANALQWTPLGGMVTLAVMAALAMVASYGILTEYRPPRAMYVIAMIMAVAGLVILMSVNARMSWLVLGAGSLVFLVGALIRKEEILSRAMLAPCIGVFLSVVYLLMTVPGLITTPQEVQITAQESVRIARLAVSSYPMLGSGPGTYAYDFARWHNEGVTKSGLWNIPFHSGMGSIITFTTTVGLVGAIFWILFLGGSFIRALRDIIRDRRTGSFLAIGAVVVAAIGAVIFMPVSLPLLFLLAIFIGLMLSEGTYRELSMARSERGSGVRNAVGAIILLFVVVGSVILVRRTGGIYFAVQAMQSFAQSPAKASESAARAIQFDNGHDGYWRMLSDARRAEVASGAKKQFNSQAELSQYQFSMRQMVDAANRSTVLAPGASMNWGSLGQAYLVASSVNPQALDKAHEAFIKARELNPYDPSIITILGVTERLQAIAASKDGKVDTAKAVASLQQAIALQPTYAVAHIELARLYAAALDHDKAVASYANAQAAAPYDPLLAYEIAAYLKQDKDTTGAIAELERAIQLAPNFVDAHVAVSDLYVFTGDNDKAIAHLEVAVKLLPENKDLQAKLEALKEKAATPPKKRR